jgi:hypothetical protein
MTREHSARCAAAVVAMLRGRMSLAGTLAVIDGRQLELGAGDHLKRPPPPDDSATAER